MDGCIQFGIAAGIQVSKTPRYGLRSFRVGIAVGSGIGGIKMIQETHSVLNSGPRKVSPFLFQVVSQI